MDFFFFFFFGGGGGGWALRNRTTFFFFFFFFFLGGWGCHFYTFKGVLMSRYRIGIFFWAANFEIFFSIPDIPVFWGVFWWGGVGGKL